jgi:hypothetical protein
MSGRIKIGATVETPHGSGVVVKVERYKCFRRWAVLYDKSPFHFNPVWYHHKLLKTKKMDIKKEIELIELRAQVSLLYELLNEINDNKITAILQEKHEQINELEKQIHNETNV